MISALFALLLIADTTHAEGASVPAESSVEVKKEKEKKVCREDATNTGSRMRKKICMTPTEWAKRDSGRSAGDLRTIGAR